MDVQMDQYMALSKKDLQISITLNELYNTQSLLDSTWMF
jgi:Ras GTPase-activating-like protein IQGAP2/3